jgi:hypothetical protein
MVTLRERVADRDAESFVGRGAELEVFGRVLGGDDPARIVFVHGPGGIGKSSLLREVVRRARRRGYDAIWVDGREVAPFPQQIESMVAEITDAHPAVVVFDSYELIASLDGSLRDVIVPDLPDETIVVFASRQPPARGWFEGGWDTLVRSMPVGPLDRDDAMRLATAHGAGADEVAALVDRSHGSPLALVAGAESGPDGSVATLAERLLGDEVEPSRYRTLGVAAIARVTTPELLADVLGDGDPQDSFKWLASRSFAEPLAHGVALHALVADAVKAQLRLQDPAGEAELRRRIADHLHRRALAGHRGLSTELQHLVVDPNVRWGFASDVGERYHIDAIRAGDAEIIGRVLEAVGAGEWWSLTRVFLEQHPEFCGVARDAEGRVGGYFVAVAPNSAPPAAEADPLLGPWLRHARETLRTNRAVLWRDAIDLTGEMGEVTSLLGAGGLLSTGVANPRYGFLPISPVVPAARLFSEALGATHEPSLDVATHGQELACHIVDFGPTGLLGFQRDWIYRETGARPRSDAPEVEPIEVLKLLRDPDRLAHGPSWLGSSPSARLDRLRQLVEDSLVVFGDHRDDELAREIIAAAFLGQSAPHDAIARQLHLSRSAYFRRLHGASERVSEELAARLRGDV